MLTANVPAGVSRHLLVSIGHASLSLRRPPAAIYNVQHTFSRAPHTTPVGHVPRSTGGLTGLTALPCATVFGFTCTNGTVGEAFPIQILRASPRDGDCAVPSRPGPLPWRASFSFGPFVPRSASPLVAFLILAKRHPGHGGNVIRAMGALRRPREWDWAQTHTHAHTHTQTKTCPNASHASRVCWFRPGIAIPDWREPWRWVHAMSNVASTFCSKWPSTDELLCWSCTHVAACTALHTPGLGRSNHWDALDGHRMSGFTPRRASPPVPGSTRSILHLNLVRPSTDADC